MRNRKTGGLTLLEVLVTGTLFGIVMTMVGRALVLGYRAQSTISQKIQVHREASAALDMLVRDAQLARFSGNVNLNIASSPTTVPTTLTSVTVANEFRIDRMTGGTTLYDAPVPISVGYWRRNSDKTLRRTQYNSSGTVLAGTPAGGKVVGRDVQEFQVSLVPDYTTGLSTLTAELTVSTIQEPLSTQVYLEIP